MVPFPGGRLELIVFMAGTALTPAAGDFMDARSLLAVSRYLGSLVALVRAGFWVFFAAASMASEGDAPPRTLLLLVALLGALFLTTAALSWRYEMPCAIALLLGGAFLLILCFTFFHRSAFLIAALSAPPLAAGVLLLLWWRYAG